MIQPFMKRFLAFAFATVSLIGTACPPNMEGGPKTAAIFRPGKNVDQFSMYSKKHLEFLADQMKAGTIQYAGPFLKDADVDGGLTIFNETDHEIVKKLLQNDPIVANKVMDVDLKNWLECRLK